MDALNLTRKPGLPCKSEPSKTLRPNKAAKSFTRSDKVVQSGTAKRVASLRSVTANKLCFISETSTSGSFCRLESTQIVWPVRMSQSIGPFILDAISLNDLFPRTSSLSCFFSFSKARARSASSISDSSSRPSRKPSTTRRVCLPF